jgi:hypothetical protein
MYVWPMKKLLLTLSLVCSGLFLFAQTQHGSFAQDKELENALLNYDMKAFVTEPVMFTADTVERKVNAADLSILMKQYFPQVKKTVVKKASETNNGYVQSFGMYNQEEDALYYIRFVMNPLTAKLEEVVIEKNN